MPGRACLRYAPARPTGRAMAWVGSLIICGTWLGGRSGTMVQEVHRTHPQIRSACLDSISGGGRG